MTLTHLPTPFSRSALSGLLLVLLVAMLMRFLFPSRVEYFHDEAMLSTMAQEMARDGRIPLTGILSSTGIPNPPTSVYVMAIPFLLSPDPFIATLYVMTLNVVGVGLLWLLAFRYLGLPTANLAALFYALSPYAVWFSRKIWAQDFHTPFLLLSLLLLCYGLLEYRPHRWAQALAIPIALFAMQIHFAAWALVPLFFLLAWVGRKHLSWKAIEIGTFLGFLVLLPYLIGLAQTLNADPNRIANALNREGVPTNPSTFGQSLVNMLVLASGQIDIATANTASLPPLATLVVGIPMIALTGLGIIQLFRTKQRLRWAILWWAFGAALLLIVPITPIHVHYFVASLPALMLLAAQGYLFLNDQLKNIPRVVWQSLLGLLLSISVVHWFTVLQSVNMTAWQYPAFTTPMSYLLQIRDEISASQEDVVVVSNGMAWDTKHDVAVWETLLRERVACVRTIKDGYIVQPNHPFKVLITPDGMNTALADLYLAKAISTLTIEARKGESFALLNMPVSALSPNNQIEPITFSNGVSLLGYDHKEAGITLYWQLSRQPERGEDYQFTVQAYNNSGERIAQQDGRFWQGMHWCNGDILTIDVPLTISSDTNELHVGLYQLGQRAGEFLSVEVLDAGGNPSGQSAVVIIGDP